MTGSGHLQAAELPISQARIASGNRCFLAILLLFLRSVATIRFVQRVSEGRLKALTQNEVVAVIRAAKTTP
jgi:hypothetical protein